MRTNYIIVLTLFLLVVVTVLAGKERFSTGNVMYTTNRLNLHTWVQEKTSGLYDVESIPTLTWKTIRANLAQTGTMPSLYKVGRSSVLLTLDPLEGAVLGNQWAAPALNGPEGYFVVITDSHKSLHRPCNIQFTGARVGWYDISDYHLLKAFQKGYRISEASMELVQISLNDLPKVAEMLAKGELDFMVTYVVPSSAYCAFLKQLPIVITGFQDLNIDRIKLFHPFVSTRTVNLREMFMDQNRTTKAFVPEKAASYPVLSMRLGIHHIYGTMPAIQEPFITRFVRDDEAMDPRYTCYGDSRIESKAECNSPYDAIGLPKRFESTWDRPCTQDIDCPFFQANTHYPNLRGKCLPNGVCEMPVGTQRVSYRKIAQEDIYKPFCYNCDSLNDPSCCGTLEQPDYAFPNDYDDRVRAGLPSNLSVE